MAKLIHFLENQNKNGVTFLLKVRSGGYALTPHSSFLSCGKLQWIFLKGVEDGGEIALAGVGQESDYALAFVLGTLGYLGGGKGGGTR